MKILLLIRSLTYGGAQRQLVNLATGSQEQGCDVRVAVFYRGGHLQKELEEAGVTVLWLGKMSRWDIMGPLLRFVMLVKATRPTVVYSWMPLANIVATLTKPFLPGKTRIVWGVRASNMDLNRYNWLSRVSWKMEIWLSRFADLIIANSYAGRNHAIRHGFSDRAFEVVPNGIDTERFRVLPDLRIKLRREWRIRDSQLLIGLVARLDPMKDHSVFLRAAALLAKERDDVRFVCVGDGPDAYKMELHKLSHELGLDSVLIWAGSRSDMPAVHNALDILVSSSSYGEGFSNVIVEAMACGVPCVVTNVGDSARIIGEVGVVVHPGDTDALFTSIQKLVDSKDRWSLMDVRQSVVHRYDKRTMVLRTEKQLEKNHG